MSMKQITSWRLWIHGLGATVIGGSASAGAAWLSTVAAKAAGVTGVQELNAKSLGIILISSGLLNAFLYLKQSPLPALENETTTEPTKP